MNSRTWWTGYLVNLRINLIINDIKRTAKNELVSECNYIILSSVNTEEWTCQVRCKYTTLRSLIPFTAFLQGLFQNKIQTGKFDDGSELVRFWRDVATLSNTDLIRLSPDCIINLMIVRKFEDEWTIVKSLLKSLLKVMNN